MYIVELEKGVWIAPWTGDSGRTVVKENALEYHTEHGAKTGLGIARIHRPFVDGKVINLEENQRSRL